MQRRDVGRFVLGAAVALIALGAAAGALASDADVDLDFAHRVAQLEAAGVQDGTLLGLLRDWERSALTRARKDIASEVLEREIAVRRARPESDDVKLFDAMVRLGRWLNDVGPYARAEAVLREAMTRVDRIPDDGRGRVEQLYSALETTISRLRPTDPEREALLVGMVELESDAGTLYRLGSFYRSVGRPDDALGRFDDALALAGRGPLRSGWGMTAYLGAMGRVHRELGHESEAEQLMVEALGEAQAYLGSQHPYLASPLKALGRFLQGQDRDAEAELYLRPAAEIELNAWGEAIPCGCPAQEMLDAALPGFDDDPVDLAKSAEHPRAGELRELEASIDAMRALGEFELAIPVGWKAAELRREIHGDDSPEFASGLDAVARLLIRRTRHADAIDVLKRSVAVRMAATPSPAGRRAHAAALKQLAESLRTLRRYDEARVVIDDEIRLHEADARRMNAARRMEVAGHLARTVGDTADARVMFERAAGMWREMTDGEPPELVRLRAAVATTHLVDGAFDTAEAILVPLLDEVETRWPRERSTLFQVRFPLRKLYISTDRPEVAAELRLDN